MKIAITAKGTEMDSEIDYDTLVDQLVERDILKRNKRGAISIDTTGYELVGGHYGQEAEARRRR